MDDSCPGFLGLVYWNNRLGQDFARLFVSGNATFNHDEGVLFYEAGYGRIERGKQDDLCKTTQVLEGNEGHNLPFPVIIEFIIPDNPS